MHYTPTCGKQVIIASDRQDFCSERTTQLLSEFAVLNSSSNEETSFLELI